MALRPCLSTVLLFSEIDNRDYNEWLPIFTFHFGNMGLQD